MASRVCPGSYPPLAGFVKNGAKEFHTAIGTIPSPSEPNLLMECLNVIPGNSDGLAVPPVTKPPIKVSFRLLHLLSLLPEVVIHITLKQVFQSRGVSVSSSLGKEDLTIGDSGVDLFCLGSGLLN